MCSFPYALMLAHAIFQDYAFKFGTTIKIDVFISNQSKFRCLNEIQKLRKETQWGYRAIILRNKMSYIDERKKTSQR